MIGLGAGLALSAFGSIISGLWNAHQQQQNRNYQRDIQQQLFDREDDALQRMKKDAEAAGLSPYYSHAGAAGAGQNVPTQAAQFSKANLALELLGKKSQIENIREDSATKKALQNLYESQAGLYSAQKGKIGFEQKLMTGQTSYYNSLSNKSDQEIEFLKRYNPERLRKMELENTFANDSMNNRISLLATQIQKNIVDQYKIGALERYYNTQITYAEKRMLLTDKQVQMYTHTLKEAEQKAAIAIIHKLNESYNRTWYKSRHLPVNSGLDTATRWLNTLSGDINQSLDKLFDWDDTGSTRSLE